MKGFIFSLLLLAVLVVAGCSAGGLEAYLDSNYPLYDLRASRYGTDDAARVYELPQPVAEAAQHIAEKFPPQNVTGKSNDQRMILVYQDNILDIHVQDGKTLAELASKRYVRDHYDAGDFFRGYLAASIIRDIFDGPRSWGWGRYPTYPTRDTVPTFGKTVREGSVGSATVRGGGLFGGK